MNKTVLLIVVVGAVLLGIVVYRQGREAAAIPETGASPGPSVRAIDTTDWRIDNAYPDEIKVTFPQVGDVITSPLIITGEARGSWFFEANFPVILTNWDGLIIAEWYAEAQGDWMIRDFVRFTARLEFENPRDIGPWSRRGALILHNANASGLPEHDKAVEIPVLFE